MSRRWSEKETSSSRMPLKCSTETSVHKYKVFTVYLHDVRVHARVLKSHVHCLLSGAPERNVAPFGGCRMEHLTDVLLAASGLEMS